MATSGTQKSLQRYLDELKEAVQNPVQRRLLEAYRGENPVDEMELELGKILYEVVEHRED